MWCHATSFLVLQLVFSLIELEKSERLLKPNPKYQELVFHPCVNLHQEKQFQLLLNCVKLKSVSCTSNLSVQMFDFPKYTEFLLMLILNLPGLLRNQNLEIFPICIVVLCFPHNNIVGIHLYDECARSKAPSVCHKIWSISLPHWQAYSQTIKYQVSQYVPNVEISEQFVSKLWTINLPTDPFSALN